MADLPPLALLRIGAEEGGSRDSDSETDGLSDAGSNVPLNQVLLNRCEGAKRPRLESTQGPPSSGSMPPERLFVWSAASSRPLVSYVAAMKRRVAERWANGADRELQVHRSWLCECAAPCRDNGTSFYDNEGLYNETFEAVEASVHAMLSKTDLQGGEGAGRLGAAAQGRGTKFIQQRRLWPSFASSDSTFLSPRFSEGAHLGHAKWLKGSVVLNFPGRFYQPPLTDAYTGADLRDSDAEVDHVVPRSWLQTASNVHEFHGSIENDLSNMALVSKALNQSKGEKPLWFDRDGPGVYTDSIYFSPDGFENLERRAAAARAVRGDQNCAQLALKKAVAAHSNACLPQAGRVHVPHLPVRHRRAPPAEPPRDHRVNGRKNVRGAV